MKYSGLGISLILGSIIGIVSAQTPDGSKKSPCIPTTVIRKDGKVAIKNCDGSYTEFSQQHLPGASTSAPSAGTAVPSPSVIQAQEAYFIWTLQQSRTLHEWQHRSSIIIFFLVIFLVLSGIYFAAIQFHYGLGGKGKAPTTEIDASLKGVKAKSSFLGVIVLAISMAFFYLYLVNIYPIVGSPKESTTSEKAQ